MSYLLIYLLCVERIEKTGSNVTRPHAFESRSSLDFSGYPLCTDNVCLRLSRPCLQKETNRTILRCYYWWESVEISQSIIGNNRIAPTDQSSIIIGKSSDLSIPWSIPCIFPFWILPSIDKNQNIPTVLTWHFQDNDGTSDLTVVKFQT